MGVVNDGDILRVTCKMSIGADDIQNVYHCKYDGTSGQDDQDVWDDVALVLDDAYDTIDTYQTNDMDFDTIDLWNVTQDRPMIEDSWPTMVSGGGVGDPTTFQASACVLFGTTTARSQGRKFLGVFERTQLKANSSWMPALVTAIALFATEVIGSFAVGAGTAAFGNWNDALSRFSPWVSAVLQEIAKTQRRRSPGVGS